MTYNGWSNYETWSVALIVDNDEELHDQRRRLVSAVCDAVVDAYEGKADDLPAEQRWAVAEAARKWIAGASEMYAEPASDDPLSYLWAQLLGAALSEVDWSEVADAWIEDEAEVTS